MELLLIIAIAHGVAFGTLCAYIASIRNLSQAWFWAGLFFGVFALIAILVTPPLPEPPAPYSKSTVVVGSISVTILVAIVLTIVVTGTRQDGEDAAAPTSVQTATPSAINPVDVMSDANFLALLRGYDDDKLSRFSDEQVLNASKDVCAGRSNDVLSYLAAIKEADPAWQGFALKAFTAASRQRYCG
jgi:hypothetical protein